MSGKCVITGASGALGGELVRCLAAVYEVEGLCYRHSAPGLHVLDIRNEAALGAYLEQARPQIVIHCAAYRDPDYCEDHPAETRRLNVDPIRCMTACLPESVRLVLVSSDYVYSGEHPPYKEDDRVCPVNEYGQSKIEAETLLRGRANALIVRPPLLVSAGASLEDSGAVGQMARSILDGKEVEVDNVLVRFPTWTRDVAEAVKFLLARSSEGIVHVSSPSGGTRYELTRRLAKVMGRSAAHVKPSDSVIPRRAARPPNSQLDTGRLRALGFVHLTPYEEVCRRVLEQVS